LAVHIAGSSSVGSGKRRVQDNQIRRPPCVARNSRSPLNDAQIRSPVHPRKSLSRLWTNLSRPSPLSVSTSSDADRPGASTRTPNKTKASPCGRLHRSSLTKVPAGSRRGTVTCSSVFSTTAGCSHLRRTTGRRARPPPRECRHDACAAQHERVSAKRHNLPVKRPTTGPPRRTGSGPPILLAKSSRSRRDRPTSTHTQNLSMPHVRPFVSWPLSQRHAASCAAFRNHAGQQARDGDRRCRGLEERGRCAASSAATLLPGAQDADEAGVHRADQYSVKADGVIGTCRCSSAWCRIHG